MGLPAAQARCRVTTVLASMASAAAASAWVSRPQYAVGLLPVAGQSPNLVDTLNRAPGQAQETTSWAAREVRARPCGAGAPEAAGARLDTQGPGLLSLPSALWSWSLWAGRGGFVCVDARPCSRVTLP